MSRSFPPRAGRALLVSASLLLFAGISTPAVVAVQPLDPASSPVFAVVADSSAYADVASGPAGSSVPASYVAVAEPPADKAARPKEAAKASLADLAWMTGSWETTTGNARIEEHWTRPDAGTLIGMGRTIAGGKTVFFEYLRIEARPDGIFYVAHPKAASPGTDFKLVRLEAGEVSFENPAHDFPKRITYRKNPDGTLTARVEGDENGKPAREIFEYRPMKAGG